MNIDAIRLERLGDPKFEFNFAIKADGRVQLYKPAHAGEIPFCIARCGTAINEVYDKNKHHRQ